MGVIGKEGFESIEGGLDRSKLLEVSESSGSTNEKCTEVGLNNTRGCITKRVIGRDSMGVGMRRREREVAERRFKGFDSGDEGSRRRRRRR